MLSPVSRLLLALSMAGLGMGIAYQVAVDERSGTMLLLFLAAAAFIGCVATAGSAVPDQAPIVPPDAPTPERRATTTGSPARGSGWPAGAALAVATLAATAAAGGPVVWVGVLVVVVATAGWFGKVWSEDPTWTPRLHERVSLRLLVPVGLPVTMFLLAATIAVSLSRILLAVSKDSSVVVAFVAAVTILATCSWVAMRPRITSTAVLALVAAAAVSVVGAGITGVAAGERPFHPEHGAHEPVKIRAKSVKFSTDKITATANEDVTVQFENGDAGVYHNFAVYKGDGPGAAPVFNGEGIPGVNHRSYIFKAPPPGAYVFVCDFHPNMKGTFVTEPK